MTETTELDPRFNAYRPDLADISLKAFVKADRYTASTFHQCVRGVVPVYEKPDVKSHRLTEVRYGDFMDVFEEREDGFAWVQSRVDRFVGYIRSEGTINEAIAALMNRVSALQTFVYAEPDRNAAVLDRLTLGSYVSLDGESGDFYPLASGGYIFKKHVAPTDEVFCADYVFTAGQLLSTPYLQGGRTPLGVDAAGLLFFALDLAGIETPRDLAQQRETFGLPLPCHWRDVIWTRGDLVFFGSPFHAGIMTCHDHIIHADPERMIVTVQPLEQLVRRGHQLIAAGRP
ncbi:MAG: NlpC/P60 family protein [Bdellovibrionales bacterium]